MCKILYAYTELGLMLKYRASEVLLVPEIVENILYHRILGCIELS
jgi:hypothetical protein